jgi:homoserine O-succinyltransferase
MPVLLEARSMEAGVGAIGADQRLKCLEIGLLNNMSDSGLKGGERQFIGLLEDAAGDLVVRLKLYSLPQIPRGAAARERIGALYSDLPSLMRGRVDGLIVTGAEPMAGRLMDEPFWPGLTEMVDWAEHHTTSTIWSCLATHAAVMHLDGIERQPLGRKRSGVFAFRRTGDHALLAGSGGSAPIHVPHSRFNELREKDLAAHGYQILTRAESPGVDTFVKKWRSLFVYFQGHPEYDGPALTREYRRDIYRYLHRESENFPSIPENYFLADVEARMRAFETLARDARTPETMMAFPIDTFGDGLRRERWHMGAVALMRNWLAYLDAHKA